MPRFSLPRLLSSTTTFHLRYFSSVEKLRNIWISGLIDPAKVTVSERYMLYTGQMKKMDEVKIKTKRRDMFLEAMMEEERGRGDYCYDLNLNLRKREKLYPDKTYHVSADITFFNWKHHKMSVINTTDCVNFTDEVETALCAFDSSILVLSSVDGVQSQSIIVDKQMIRYELPRLVFINNVDQKGANPWEVLNQARSKLQHHSAAIQVPIGLEDDFKGLVDLVQLKAYSFHGSNGENVVVEEVPADMDTLVSEKRRELIKTVSEVDDKLAEAFCSDMPISAVDLEEAIRRATIARKFIPVFMGSAFKYKGLQLLLDGVLNYLPCPIEASNYALNQSKNMEKDELVALAFTLNRKFGPITYLRIYEGVIQKGDSITNVNTGKTFKVPSSIEIRKDEIGVPYSIEPRKDEIRDPPYVIEVQMDETGVPYVIGVRNVVKVPHSDEDRKDDFGVRHSIGVRNDEAIHEAHAGEIVALHDVNAASGDTFTDGLVRYTKASIDVSELVSRDSEVQASKVLKDFPCQA
ncbi:elongation factor G, mitochondrial-like [Trifolium pratense]|uniref:elongation factor G, mitochondrial-like n=1 Tax=Trifolium pratense TaxID=57577 RepID=UPI001E692D98|nr:elongation factor G, mitochondrial-like [Trifolium pratense]